MYITHTIIRLYTSMRYECYILCLSPTLPFVKYFSLVIHYVVYKSKLRQEGYHILL